MVDKLKLPIYKSNIICNSVNNFLFRPDGETKITLDIKGYKYQLNKVLICDKLEDDLLLGSDFHKLACLIVNYPLCTITLYTAEKKKFDK